MANDLAERLEELRELAAREGVDDSDWDVPNLPMAVQAYADALGISTALAVDPRITMDELLEARDLGIQ